MKTRKKYFNVFQMNFPVVTYQDEDGVWIGEIPVLKGVHSSAESLEDLYVRLQEAADLFFESEPDWKPKTKHYSISLLHIDAKTKDHFSQENAQMAS